jgi:hypothetical protein
MGPTRYLRHPQGQEASAGQLASARTVNKVVDRVFELNQIHRQIAQPVEVANTVEAW